MRYLILLFPLIAFAVGGSDNITYTELVTTKKSSQNISIQPTGDVVLKNYTGFLKASSGTVSAQALIDLTTDVTGVLPIANGGTGSATQNFVDLTTNQTIAGNKSFSNTAQFLAPIVTATTTDAVLTGSNAILSLPTTDIVRLTNASLVSIDEIIAPSGNQKLALVNATGVDLLVNNNTGATAVNRILTGTKANLDFTDEASLNLVYDTNEQRWLIIGGSGGGSSDAVDVAYSNATSGLTATNVQAAIDELDGTLDTALQPADILDEDNFSSDSATKAPSQQSTKKYVDNQTDNILIGDDSNFEVTVGNWLAYNDTGAFIDGTGGTGSIACSRNTTNPLNGTAQLNMTGDAADYGSGCSLDYEVPHKYSGQTIYVCFPYKLSSYLEENWKIYSYDVENSQLLPLADNLVIPAVIGMPGGVCSKYQVPVWVPATAGYDTATHRIAIHQNSNTLSGTTAIQIDDVEIGSKRNPTTNANSDWKPYSPTLTNFGNATSEFFYKKNGDTLLIKGSILIGSTLPTGSISASLPSGLNIDTSKIGVGVTGTDAYQNFGSIVARDVSTATTTSYRTASVVRDNTSLTSIIFLGDDSVPDIWNTTTPFTWAAGDTLTIRDELTIPIVGWSTGAEASSPYDGIDIIVEANNNDGEAVTGSTEDMPFKNVLRDTVGAWSNAGNTGNNTNDAFTAPVADYYDVNIKLRIASSANPQIMMFVNGADTGRRGISDSSSITQETTFLSVPLEAGDVLTFRLNSTQTLTSDTSLHRILIRRSNSGGQQKWETPSVFAKYTSDNGQAMGTGVGDLVFEDVVSGGTHPSMCNTSTGVCTLPESGCYSVNAGYITASATWTSGNLVQIVLSTAAGTSVKAKGNIAPAFTGGMFSGDLDVDFCESAGYQFKIRGNNSQSAAMGTNPVYNYLQIKRAK